MSMVAGAAGSWQRGTTEIEEELEDAVTGGGLLRHAIQRLSSMSGARVVIKRRLAKVNVQNVNELSFSN